MHSDSFQLKGLLCFCNPYAGVASARVTHQTRVLRVPALLRLPNQAPEIQVLWFTNVVWLYGTHIFLENNCHIFLETTGFFLRSIWIILFPIRSKVSYFGWRAVPILKTFLPFFTIEIRGRRRSGRPCLQYIPDFS